MIYRAIILGILLAAPGPALSTSNNLIISKNAIARLNYAGLRKKGHCTAVLFSKSKALTARHCVDKWPRKGLRLVFGYARGDWVELRTIKAIRPHKIRDLAVLCLNKPSKQIPIPLAKNYTFNRVTNAQIIGYPKSRPHLPVTKTCPLQPGNKRARFECPLEPGMSGSPLMVSIDGKPHIIGIASQTSAAYSIIERTNDVPEGDC
jgi:V8-like Glu-specific endopeptidase